LSCINYKCKVDNSTVSTLGEGDCTIEPVYFEFDSYEITEKMRSVLEKNFNCLQKKGGKVTLEGHCDAAGTTEYNMALGEKRAKRVAKFLRSLGEESSNMRIVSKGEEEASGPNVPTDRRVDFK
jgi:peptidoglycan-associated lipoprotein